MTGAGEVPLFCCLLRGGGGGRGGVAFFCTCACVPPASIMKAIVSVIGGPGSIIVVGASLFVAGKVRTFLPCFCVVFVVWFPCIPSHVRAFIIVKKV